MGGDIKLDHRGDYGVDAPLFPIGFALAECCCLALAWAFLASSLPWLGAPAAETDAEGMEHHVSKITLKAFERFLAERARMEA